MLKKLLSLTKNSKGFFLELDEDQSQEDQPKPEPISETFVAAQTAQAESETDTSDVAASENASEATAPKTERKSKKKTKQKKSPDSSPEPSVAKVSQPSPIIDRTEQLIINAVSAKNNSEAEATKSGFATDYLISKPAPNRRPGASLNKFKEMTRTMKVSK